VTSPRPNGTGLEKYLIDYKYMIFPSMLMSICSNTMAQLVRRRPVKRKVPESNPTCLRNITIFKPKKKSEKRELAEVQVVQPNGTSWHKLTRVEQVEQVEAGLQIYVEQVEQEQGGLQIDVEQVEQGQGFGPAEPLHFFFLI